MKKLLKAATCLIFPLLIGALILFFVAPPQSYVLCALWCLLTIIIVLTAIGKNFQIELRLSWITNQTLSLLLIVTTMIHILFILTNTTVPFVNPFLYVVVMLFAPGFSILKLSKLNAHNSNLELVALAYAVSVATLSISGTFLLFVSSNTRSIFMSIAILCLCILCHLKNRKEVKRYATNKWTLTIGKDTLILISLMLFFLYFFANLYPRLGNILSRDLSRNFLQALAFSKDSLGEFYQVTSRYALFNIYESYMILTIKPSIGVFHTTTIFLNIFITLSFYAMATVYLKEYGTYLPSIATLLWSLFSGFGWLIFIPKKITTSDVSTIFLISQTDVFAYGDITWRRLFEHLSMEISLALVFSILYLLKRGDIFKHRLILLMTILAIPLPLTHPYAMYLLFAMLLCFTLFSRKELEMQLSCVSFSLIIASFGAAVLSYLLMLRTGIAISYFVLLQYLMGSLAILGLAHIKIGDRLSVIRNNLNRMRKAKSPIVFTLLIVYFAALLLWFSGSIKFSFSDLNLFGYVPCFLYPAKLGIVGILAIIAFYLILADQNYKPRELLAILSSALILIFASRIIATLQMYYASEFTFNPNSIIFESLRKASLSFREERMFELFKVPLAVFASIFFSKHILTKTKLRTTRLPNYLVISGLVSFILIAGMSSTFLGFEYYRNQTETNQPNQLELDIIDTLRERTYANGKSIIISPQTPTSYLDFTGAVAIVAESPAAWTSKYPELPLFVTRYSKTTPTYFYLHKTRDYEKISDYSGTYLEHLSNTAQTYLENQEVQIKTINNWSIPTPQSSTALIIPYDESTMTIPKPFYPEAYKQYTVLMLFFEEKLQSMNLYQEPISYNNIEINGTATFNGVSSYIRINGTETNFDRISVEFEFQPIDLTRNQIIIGKFDWGTTPRQMSWDIAQFGRRIVFKISPDGNNEEVLSTGEILALNTRYTVRCEYDGFRMKIFINNKIVTSKSYQGGIFKSNIDLTIGCELYNNKPTAFANMVLRYVRVLNDVYPRTSEQNFYAYDLLSSAGFNYTIILSNGNVTDNYETLILPYDDVTTYEILTKLENNQQTNGIRYVVILNTNGYGPLLNRFGNLSNETFIADGIFASKYVPIQPPIEVPIVKLNENHDVKARYTDNTLLSPLIMTATKNQLTLIYVNIYPLAEQNQLLNPTLTLILTEEMSDYIKVYNETTVTSWFTEPSLLFTKLKASGTVSIRSDSVESIRLPQNNLVNIEGFSAIKIDSAEIIAQRGYGFYTTLIAKNPSIILQNNQSEGQTLSTKINGNVTLILRQPEISVHGEIQFENFYMLHPPTIYTDGRNTTLSGNITLYIQVSDEYSIALPYKFNSPIKVKYETPLMGFNENTTFLLILPHVILIMIFATMILLIQHSKPASRQEIKNENNKITDLKKA